MRCLYRCASIRPSLPGKTSTTFPISQRLLGNAGSHTITSWSSWRGSVSSVHLGRHSSCGKYSTIHRFQIRSLRFWAIFHCFRGQMCLSSKLGVCVEFIHPIKKWFGVSGSSSCGLIGISVRGRLFTIFSASIRTLRSVSTRGASSFSTRCRSFLTH